MPCCSRRCTAVWHRLRCTACTASLHAHWATPLPHPLYRLLSTTVEQHRSAPSHQCTACCCQLCTLWHRTHTPQPSTVPNSLLSLSLCCRFRCPAARVESSSASPPHRLREEGLAHPADTQMSNLADALGAALRFPAPTSDTAAGCAQATASLRCGPPSATASASLSIGRRRPQMPSRRHSPHCCVLCSHQPLAHTVSSVYFSPMAVSAAALEPYTVRVGDPLRQPLGDVKSIHTHPAQPESMAEDHRVSSVVRACARTGLSRPLPQLPHPPQRTVSVSAWSARHPLGHMGQWPTPHRIGHSCTPEQQHCLPETRSTISADPIGHPLRPPTSPNRVGRDATRSPCLCDSHARLQRALRART